jgi:four helix bundle protein
MKKSYKDLYIWQASIDLAVQIVAMTDDFPNRQRYVLVAQMQRAAISVPSNISEGKGRLSQRELRQYLGIARGSLFELDSQLEIATRVGLIDPSRKAHLDDLIGKLGAGINALLRHISSTAQ